MIVDSAFKLRNNPYLIRTTKMLAQTRNGILFQWDAVKLHQSAEWGMRSFQSLFTRLRDRIRYKEHGERLETIGCLYTFTIFALTLLAVTRFIAPLLLG